MKRLRESVGYLESGFKRLRVDVYSGRDRAQETAELEAMIAEQEEETRAVPVSAPAELPANDRQTPAG